MRVGIVGAGSMGHVHTPAWADLRSMGAELVGIIANHPDGSANDLAAQYGMRTYKRYEDLLTDVDIIDLWVPTDLHH